MSQRLMDNSLVLSRNSEQTLQPHFYAQCVTDALPQSCACLNSKNDALRQNAKPFACSYQRRQAQSGIAARKEKGSETFGHYYWFGIRRFGRGSAFVGARVFRQTV